VNISLCAPCYVTRYTKSANLRLVRLSARSGDVREVAIKQEEMIERWKELCRLASEEQDPKRLLDLVSQINALLEAQGPLRDEIETERKIK